MTILVIDVGSSSVRTLLFDEFAKPVMGSQNSHFYTFVTDASGTAVVDAEALREAVEACMDKTLEHPAAAQIMGVGMATFVGNMLGVDEQGTPLTPIFTYLDTRSTEDVLTLRSQIDRKETHQRTGCMHHTSYNPARFHWLRRTQSEVFHRAAKWVDFSTYLYTCWFGESPCSYSVASWGGMLNRNDMEWDAEWLSLLEVDRDTLPRLGDYNAFQTQLLPAYRQRWSCLEGLPFCLAVGDGAAANVGVGAIGQHRVALTLGTTGAFRRLAQGTPPPIPKGLWNYRLDADYHLLGGATSEGGNIFQWLQNTLALPPAADIERELSQRPPDGHGLTFLPLLPSERSPGWSVRATGGMASFNTSTTAMDILQAALEGVAIRLAMVGELLDVHDSTILAGGGALTSSPAWAQMIANALDHPLTLVDEPEVTARGAAILTLRALGVCQLGDYPAPTRDEIYPQPAHAAKFRIARERHLELYDNLNPEP